MMLCAGCVADPLLFDLTPQDLPPHDLEPDVAPNVDLRDVSDLAIVADLALSSDLAAFDLSPLIPSWIESNTGLLGGELYGVAATSSDVYVASLYDVFRSGVTMSDFARLPIPRDLVDGGINADRKSVV